MWGAVILCVCVLLGGVDSRPGSLPESILLRAKLPGTSAFVPPSPTPAQAVVAQSDAGRPGKLEHTILTRVKLPGHAYNTPAPPIWFPTPIPSQSPTIPPWQFPSPTPSQSPTIPPWQFPTPIPSQSPTIPPWQFPSPTPSQSPIQPPTPDPLSIIPRREPTPVRHVGSVRPPARQPFNPLLNINKYLRNTPQPNPVFPTIAPTSQPNPTFPTPTQPAPTFPVPTFPVPTFPAPTFPPIVLPTTTPPSDLSVCPNGQPRLDCRASTNCSNVKCKAYPNAECRLDSCDNCRPQFFAEGCAVACDTCRNGYKPNTQRWSGGSDICANSQCGEDSHCYPVYCSAPSFRHALFECVKNCRNPVTGQLMGDGRRPECLKPPCAGVFCPNNYICQPDPCTCTATCQFVGATLSSGQRTDGQTQTETDNTPAQADLERQTPETTTSSLETTTSSPETTTSSPETTTLAPEFQAAANESDSAWHHG